MSAQSRCKSFFLSQVTTSGFSSRAECPLRRPINVATFSACAPLEPSPLPTERRSVGKRGPGYAARWGSGGPVTRLGAAAVIAVKRAVTWPLTRARALQHGLRATPPTSTSCARCVCVRCKNTIQEAGDLIWRRFNGLHSLKHSHR